MGEDLCISMIRMIMTRVPIIWALGRNAESQLLPSLGGGAGRDVVRCVIIIIIDFYSGPPIQVLELICGCKGNTAQRCVTGVREFDATSFMECMCV